MSRGCARSHAPADHYGLRAFSPFTLPNVVEVSEGIPFIELTNWDHGVLYGLKGEVVSQGVRAVTGLEMPVFEKRRFQHGVAHESLLKEHFPERPAEYRALYQSIFDGPAAAHP